MSETNTCPECGAKLAASAPRGLCPACLLQRGLESNTVGFTDEGPAARWTPPPIDELATRFPELEITRLLGRGGMGAVYQARQKNLDRTVALKILPPEMAQDPAGGGFAERFAREAQSMARLNHPHIVAIYDFGQRSLPPSTALKTGHRTLDTPVYYFLMEFVDGLSLRALLDTGHIAPKEALAIVPQICEALQYAHDQGIVHRDIKPENILLNKAGQVKIADFGLAKLMGASPPPPFQNSEISIQNSSATEAHKILGTPQYMAPEQISHPADVDHRADIYSLGVVFYQMLTGELPTGKFAAPSKKVRIDVRLDEIVLRALEHEPQKRYQQVSQIKTEVETLAIAPPDASPAAPPPVSLLGPTLAFGLLYAAFLFFLAASRDLLPNPLATHFGSEGQPNGWMSPAQYFIFLSLLPLGLLAVFGFISQLTRHLPPRFVNIPRRDYWLAPEHRIATSRLLWRYLLSLACIITTFFMALHALTIQANRATPPHLPMGPLLGITIGFLVLLIVWLTILLMRFAEPPGTVSGYTGLWPRGRSAATAPSNPSTPIHVAADQKTLEPARQEVPAAPLSNAPPPRSFIGKIFLWTARILGSLWAVMLLMFVLGEGSPALGSQPPSVQWAFASKGLWLLGFVIGWRYAGIAAILILLGSAIFHGVEGRFPLGLALELPTIIGLLYAMAALLSRWQPISAPPWRSRFAPSEQNESSSPPPKKFGLAHTALGLSILGLLGELAFLLNPPLGLWRATADVMIPLSILILAMLLTALVLGIKTRQRWAGKIALIIAATTILWPLLHLRARTFTPTNATIGRSGTMAASSPAPESVPASFATQTLLRIDPAKLAAEGRLLGGVPVTVDGHAALKIENLTNLPRQISLFTIDHPPITAPRYALTGEIKYENVQGDAYLELWNCFPPPSHDLPEERYFSRTLAPANSGPLAKITGTSSWRPFSLPFDRTGTPDAPTRLELNIFLPARGVVFLGPIKLSSAATQPAGELPLNATPTVADLPPVVVRTQPASGARDVAPGVTEIRATFSKDMTDNSWSWTTAWKNSTPDMVGQPRFDADHRTAIITVKLEPGQTYGYWINAKNFHNFKDTDGHPAVPYLLIFQTKPAATTKE